MVLLTVVTVLSITSPGLTYFITGSVYLLTTFIHLAHPADSLCCLLCFFSIYIFPL